MEPRRSAVLTTAIPKKGKEKPNRKRHRPIQGVTGCRPYLHHASASSRLPLAFTADHSCPQRVPAATDNALSTAGHAGNCRRTESTAASSWNGRPRVSQSLLHGNMHQQVATKCVRVHGSASSHANSGFETRGGVTAPPFLLSNRRTSHRCI